MAFNGTWATSNSYANGQQLNGEVDRSLKHAKSEEKRVQSLLQKREWERQRQSVVSDTLKKVDLGQGTGLNKKIRFDSDSDDDGPTPATPSTSTATANGSAKNYTNGALSSTSTSKKKGPALFDEEDDGDAELEQEDVEFALKPQFFGKKGAELMALEARFGGDNRFKLTEDFIEEDNIDPRVRDSQQIEKIQQQNHSLSILERVLGKNLHTNYEEDDGAVASAAASSRPMIVRFDPNNPEHERYDLAKPAQKEQASSSSGEESDSEDDEKDEQKPVAKKPKHVPSFHMDSDFAEALRARLAQPTDAKNEESARPFSLLSALGRKPPDAPPVVTSTYSTEKLPQLQKWQTNMADSSESEGETEKAGEQRRKVHTTNTDGGCWFFLDADDPVVSKAVQRFRRTEDVEVVKTKWSKYRESIVKSYKRQRRLAVQTAKTKMREQYRSQTAHTSTAKQSSEQPAKDSGTSPRQPSTAKQPRMTEKNPNMKAKRLAKRKRRIATKKAKTEQ